MRKVSYAGIIFDVDGTLTDSPHHYAQLFAEFAVSLGVPMETEQLLAIAANSGSSAPWEMLFPLSTPTREELIAACIREIPRLYGAVVEKTQLLPGVQGTLNTLLRYGVRLGVFTASRKRSLRSLTAAGLEQMFTGMVTREDGLAPKPSPEGVLRCLAQMGVHPESAAMVGDSPVDIRSGKAAGVRTIGVLSGVANRSQLEEAEPDVIVQDVSELTRLITWHNGK